MSISILNRGASGGMKPVLTVVAPSGSTIDLLQSGIIVDTYTLGASETEHTFVVKVGTYTVRGILGEKTESTEVVIDTVGYYEVTIKYRYWLYNEGDEYTENSGGWTEAKWRGRMSTLTREKRGDCLYAYGKAYTSTGCFFGWSTVNKIDLTNISKIKAVVTTGGSGFETRVVLTSNIVNAGYGNSSTSNSPSIVKEAGFYFAGAGEIEMDVSGITGTAHIQMITLVSNSTDGWLQTYKVWLE